MVLSIRRSYSWYWMKVKRIKNKLKIFSRIIFNLPSLKLRKKFKQIKHPLTYYWLLSVINWNISEIIDRYEETGQLDAGEYTMLTDLINQKRLSLDLHNPNWVTNSFKEILKYDEIFGLLPDKILSVLD